MSVQRILFIFALSIATVVCYSRVITMIDSDGSCTKAGFTCEGCTTSCYQLPNGTWMKQLIQEDPSYQPSEEEKRAFVCNQWGVFPDPFNCSKYHICIPNESGSIVDHEETCRSDFHFSPVTMQCSNKMKSACTPPVPECKTLNQGPVAHNPRLYHQCIPVGWDLMPRIYACPTNQRFIKNRCHNMDEDYGVEGNVCKETGNLYRPNCRTYHDCWRVNDFARQLNCSLGYAFSTTIGYCVNPDYRMCKLLY